MIFYLYGWIVARIPVTIGNMNKDILPVYTREIVTPVGQMLAAASDEGLFFLGFPEDLELGYKLKAAMSMLGGRFVPSAGESPGNMILEKLGMELKEYFAGSREEFSVPLILLGTGFQKRAWKTLLKIPYGEVWSYSRQAEVMGNSSAVRAVGSANGKNRIPVVIPCHRIIRKDGSAGGYAGGLWRKEFLLNLERKTFRRENQL